ncbi:putative lyr family protein [Botrytis fragariae]|uniref:Putative lyr family protein n=2 Tax=Botrytis TaxID=33196 RepID=A0A8H6B403_9HELO|nr:putative lyr family protein [Botrytis fragariae]KAF5878587.1 putative lyr family protein [Botrytis fragariae]
MSVVAGLKGEASQQARSLYRQLLRQGGQFAAYNFREYAKRRTRDSFREHKDVQDERKVQELMQKGLKELQSLKRQTVVSQFFQLDRLVVEGGKSGKQSGGRNDIMRQKDTGIMGDSLKQKGYLSWSITSTSRLTKMGVKTSSLASNTGDPNSLISPVELDTSFLPPNSFSTQRADMPAYRTGGRRQNRTGYVDHDILEGIPVRQWRREFVTVAPPPPQESNASQNDIWAKELPWGMPKDSHLLPQHSQDLLRAARSGKIYKRPTPMDEEEQDLEAILGDKPDKKEEETRDSGFTARAWKQIPGHQNASDMDFLAKRRKGLGSTIPKPAPVPTVVQTTVRRTDAAGNEYLEKVIVPHGQTVVGDVVSQTTIPDPNAIEGTPFRRKGPVGKKGKRGPGRGRKKILPTSTPNVTSEPLGQNGDAANSHLGADGIKIEGEGGATPAKNLDTEMIDDSNPASDDDVGDEGDQGDDDDDSVDILNSPSRPHRDSSQDHNISTTQEIPKSSSVDVTMGGTDIPGPTKLELERVKDEGKFGSPLKQIALTTSTVNTPTVSPTETTAREPISFSTEKTDIPLAPVEKINQEMLSIAEVSASTELPPVPSHPTEEHEEVSVELRAEEEEEEEMLLDILENTGNPQIGAASPTEAEIPSLSPAVQASIQSPVKPSPIAEEKTPQNFAEPSPTPVVEEPPTVPSQATAQSEEAEQPIATLSSTSPVREIEQPVVATSSASPVREEVQPVAPTSPPLAAPEATDFAEVVIEPTEISPPTEETKQVESIEQNEPVEPNASTELDASTEPKESVEADVVHELNDIDMIDESNKPDVVHESNDIEMTNESNESHESNEPQGAEESKLPAEPVKSTGEEEDEDDFPDLLGGLERNLYGSSQLPATSLISAAPSASIASESIEPTEPAKPTEPIEENIPLPKEVESDTKTEEKGKDVEVKEEASTS